MVYVCGCYQERYTRTAGDRAVGRASPQCRESALDVTVCGGRTVCDEISAELGGDHR